MIFLCVSFSEMSGSALEKSFSHCIDGNLDYEKLAVGEFDVVFRCASLRTKKYFPRKISSGISMKEFEFNKEVVLLNSAMQHYMQYLISLESYD